MYPLICGCVAKNRPDLLIKCTLRHARSYSNVENQSKKCIPQIVHSERFSNSIIHTSKRSLASYCDTFYRHNISNSDHRVSPSPFYVCNSIQNNGRLIHNSASFLTDEPSSKIEIRVPLDKYSKTMKEVGKLNEQLDLARTCIQSLSVLNDLRFIADNRLLKYSILTPKFNDWKQEASKKIVSVFPNWQITIPVENETQSLNPPARAKLFNTFDDTFLEWVHILSYSQHSEVKALRKSMTPEEKLINIASNATFVMIMGHESHHQIIPKNVLGVESVDRKMIEDTLKEEYGLGEAEISDLLILLGK